MTDYNFIGTIALWVIPLAIILKIIFPKSVNWHIKAFYEKSKQQRFTQVSITMKYGRLKDSD